MEQKPETLRARQSAVSIHDQLASWLVREYQTAGIPTNSAFLYGRAQIKLHFDRVLSDLPREARILDVGCGTGQQLEQLHKKGFEALGIDPAEEMLRIAQSRLTTGTVRQGSVLDIPYPNNAFDLVYANEVFRYLCHEDNIRGLGEVSRVLKRGGVFFGTYVNLYALDGFRVLVGLRSLREKWTHHALDCHTEFETPTSLERMLRDAGFSRVEIHGAMFASLRFAYKLGPIGKHLARALEPLDPKLSDTPTLRRFAGHLIGIAWK